MMGVAWVFHLRFILWGFGGGLCMLVALAWISGRLRYPRFLVISDFLYDLGKTIQEGMRRKFSFFLFFLVCGFIFLGSLEKWGQLHSFSLHSEDFWLFQDMLQNLTRGGFFLTRFAPQAQGIVQHGAVHANWSWVLAVPMAWIFGPTTACLLYGPISLGLAAVFFAWIVRPRIGEFAALCFSLAFLCSTQVGKVLEYDVHPEVAYPWMVFAWAWAIGLGDGKIRWGLLLASTLGGIGVKEDSFLVFSPWLFWGILTFKGEQKKAAVFSGICASIFYAFSVLSINRWASGHWGPVLWEGLPVTVPEGADLIKKIHWSSPLAFVQVLRALIRDAGGALGAIQQILHFWISRPWISLLILSPWVLLEKRFYLLMTPLAIAYSLLQRASLLNLYYSAPFLASFWLLAVFSKRLKQQANHYALYALLAACILGKGAIQIPIPSQDALKLEDEVRAFMTLIPTHLRGLVQTPLIGLVPRSQVWGERIPESWDFNPIDFVFLSPEWVSFEMNQALEAQLIAQLSASHIWREIKVPQSKESKSLSHLRFFLKDSLPHSNQE